MSAKIRFITHFTAAALLFGSMTVVQPDSQPVESAPARAVERVVVFRTGAKTPYDKDLPTSGISTSSDDQWLESVNAMMSAPFLVAFESTTVDSVALGPSRFEDGPSRMEVLDAALQWFGDKLGVRFPKYVTGEHGNYAVNPGQVVLELDGLVPKASYSARCGVLVLEEGGKWTVTVDQLQHDITPLASGDLIFGLESSDGSATVTITAPTQPCSVGMAWCNVASPYLFGCYLERN